MFGPIVPSAVASGLAASTAGSLRNDPADRAGRAEAAAHRLVATRDELTLHPLDAEAEASPDRDADGRETGGEPEGRGAAEPPAPAAGKTAPLLSPRPPDDSRGGLLDVTV